MTKKAVPSCHPYFKVSNRQAGTWTVPNLCHAYKWPAGLAGRGVIGIVELGGGWVEADMTAFFKSIHQPVPKITDISVGGVNNTKHKPKNDADIEVALDIQVAAAAYYVATGQPADIRMYWANDIAPGVQAATADKCDVISISWGADEAVWGHAALQQRKTRPRRRRRREPSCSAPRAITIRATAAPPRPTSMRPRPART
jgi:hypothetical protein